MEQSEMNMAKRKKKIKVVIKKHFLLPEHIKISEKEKKELLEKYNITLQNLPKILTTDAALQTLKVKPGDVIKIIRNSPTAGTSLFYRCVI
tara:strand:+ start:33 stop:305 length:273 start_codon:yes stop_codon:yes gene_type:complete